MTKMGKTGLFTTLAILVVLQASFLATPGPTPHLLRDIDGKLHGSLEDPSGWKWTLLFFTIHDCPITNQYAPEIKRICASYGTKGVRCFLVYADPSVTPAEIRTHLKDFKYEGIPAILDSRHELVQKAGATTSSEVAVFTGNGELKYRGRIDNSYAAIGKPRRVITERDLRDSLDALMAGRPVPHPTTQAFGCFIPSKQEK